MGENSIFEHYVVDKLLDKAESTKAPGIDQGLTWERQKYLLKSCNRLCAIYVRIALQKLS